MQKDNLVFTIYVVGGMATGKSTLINAMIGKKLMPYNHTSLSLICVEHANTNEFQGIAYDVSKQEIMKDDNLTRHTLQEWNDDERITLIKVKGRIPFVDSLGVKVRIVEVSSWYKSKEFFEFLQDIACERSLVVIIGRADGFLSTDECGFFDYIYNIKKGNAQSCEGLIFAINQMDRFNPEEESIENALVKIKNNLERRGIFNPNIFPVSAHAAFEARTRPLIEQIIPIYRQYIKHFPSTHYDSYYNYTHLPDYIRLEIEYDLIMAKNNSNQKEGEYATIEIHSGIVSLEKAITLYMKKHINK